MKSFNKDLKSSGILNEQRRLTEKFPSFMKTQSILFDIYDFYLPASKNVWDDIQ